MKQARYKKNLELSILFLVFGRDMGTGNCFSTIEKNLSIFIINGN